MITFGYKNRLNGPLRALVALALGIMMLAWPHRAPIIAVQAVAVVMLISGLVSLFYALRRKGQSDSTIMVFNTVVNILLAIILFWLAGPISRIVIYVIGLILLLFGLFQILALWRALLVLKQGYGRLIMPIILIAGAIAILMTVGTTWVSYLAGAILIIYAFSELMSSWTMRKAINEYEIHRTEGAQPNESRERAELSNVKDVEFEKVDKEK